MKELSDLWNRTGDEMKKQRGKFLSLIRMLILVCSVIFVGCAPKSTPVGGDIETQINAAMENGQATFTSDNFNQLLSETVNSGRVNYPLLLENRERLDNYLARIAQTDLASLKKNELYALLINAYNGYTLQSILDHPGVTSIKEIPGVWKKIEHRVGGHDITLDTLEHGVLRPYFNDARVHFVINCASRSCAPLASHAYTGQNLEQELEASTRLAFSSNEFLKITDKSIFTTAYLKWFREDFPEPREFIIRYAPESKANWMREHPDVSIGYLDYDWSLNGTSLPK